MQITCNYRKKKDAVHFYERLCSRSDIDECLEWTFQCPDPSQRCQNTQGFYKCNCEDGLYWINETCKGKRFSFDVLVYRNNVGQLIDTFTINHLQHKNIYGKVYKLFRFVLFKGLDKDEKPPPPPPAPTPRQPSHDEKLQALIITLEGLYAPQVLSLIPQKYNMV